MARIPEPKRLVRAPALRGVPESRGDIAQARVGQVAAGIADQATDFFYDVAAKDAAKKGKDAANAFIFDKDPETGHIIPPQRPNIDGKLIPSIYDQAHHEGLTTRYQQEVLINANDRARQIANENRDNKAGFDAAWQAYKEETVSNVPPEMRGSVDTALSVAGVPYGNQIAKTQAENQYQVNKNRTFEKLNMTVDELEQLIASGASAEEQMAKAETLGKEMAGSAASLDSTDVDLFNRYAEGRIVYADISRQLHDLGAPGSPGTQANEARIAQKILDGTLTVNVLGRKRKISNVLDIDQRTAAVSRLKEYSARNARIRALNIQATKDAYDRALMPKLINAYVRGDPIDIDQIAADAEKYKIPEVAMHVLSMGAKVNGIAHQRQAALSDAYNMQNTVDMFQNAYDNDAAMRAWMDKQVEGSGKTVQERLDLATFMNARDRTRQSAAVMKDLADYEQAIPTLSADQRSLNEAMLTAQRNAQNAAAYCDTLVGRSAEVCRASIDLIKAPDLTKKQKKQVAGILDAGIEAESKAPVDWSSQQPDDVKVQDFAATMYAKAGAFSDAYIEHLQSALAAYAYSGQVDTAVIEQAARLFEISSAEPRAAGALSGALSKEYFDAYDDMVKLTSYEGYDSPKVRDRILAHIDPKTPMPDPNPVHQNTVNSMVYNVDSDEFDDMHGDAKKFVAGNMDRMFWFRPQLPADDSLQTMFINNSREIVGTHYKDIKKLSKLAFDRATEKAVKSTSTYTPQRANFQDLQQRDWMGRDIAAEQWVPAYEAPEGQFKFQDPRQPGLTMTAFKYFVEKKARKINPDINPNLGVNISVKRVAGVSEDSGGAVFRITGITPQARAVFEGTNEAYVDFKPIEKQIEDGTLKELEQLRNLHVVEQMSLVDPELMTLEQHRNLKKAIADLEDGYIPYGVDGFRLRKSRLEKFSGLPDYRIDPTGGIHLIDE